MKPVGASHARKPSSSERRRILFVEDEAENYHRVASRLGARYELLWARNATEAGELLAQHGHELSAILMDIQLQGSTMNGIELTRAIRGFGPQAPGALPAVPVLSQVPIVFVSGCIGQYPAEELESAGGNALVGKPIDFHELSAVLGALIAA